MSAVPVLMTDLDQRAMAQACFTAALDAFREAVDPRALHEDDAEAAAWVVPRPEALGASQATLRPVWPWPRESSPDGRIHRTGESRPNHPRSTRVPEGATDL